jgi:DNA-binding SARP family transcriptional activator
MAALAVVVIGLPVLLYRLGGLPVPRRMPGLSQISGALLRRDDGTLFLAAVRDISWMAWAAFTTAVIAEVQAQLRGRSAPRLRVAGLQGLAGWLVAVAAMTLSGSPAALVTTAPSALVAAAHVSADRPAGVRYVTVQPGDCLWSIASRYLGSGYRYPEIVDLNLGRDMGNGEVFRDPADIWPGWVLRLPAPAHRPDPAPAGGGAPGPGGPGHDRAAGLGEHAGHPGGDPQFGRPHLAARQAAGKGHRRSARADGAYHPRPVSGLPALGTFAAGMLAGGLIVTLGRMRHRQRQYRRRGRRIRMPVGAPVMAAEHRLRAAASQLAEAHDLEWRDRAAWPQADAPDPAGRTMQAGAEDPAPTGGAHGGSALRLALSSLGQDLIAAGQPVPEIAAVALNPLAMDLMLASPASEPPPWPFIVPGGRMGTIWRLPLDELRSAEPGPPAGGDVAGDLLPGLVTAGLTEDGGALLLNLEYLRVTTVTGPADLVRLVLASAGAELASSELAGWYELLLVGFPELEQAAGRAACCDTLGEALDRLAAKAVRLRRALASGDEPEGGQGYLNEWEEREPASIPARRMAEPADEEWTLALLVSTVTPTKSQLAFLADLASGPGGVAALVPAPAGTDDVGSAQIRLTADPDAAGGVLASIVPLGLEAWPQPLTAEDYRALGDLFAAAADIGDLGPADPPYDRPSWPEAASGLAEDGAGEPGGEAEIAGAADAPGSTVVAARVAPAEDTGRNWMQDSLQVSVLGSFTVNGAPAALQPAQSQLILALALNGHDGLSNGQLCYLLGADPDHPKPADSLRQLIARTRRQLGRAPDGREWIEHLGGGQYALHPLARLDWNDFEERAGRGLRDNDPHSLRDALALIRGRPFTGCYYWWLDLALTETVRAQIVDAADLLAELELAAGDAAASARAARTGLAADPVAEQLWRALMRAEHAAGNLSGVREAWRRCLDAISEIAPAGEPHPETAELYRHLTGGPRPQPAWTR